MYFLYEKGSLKHHGILGQKWGVRRFQYDADDLGGFYSMVGEDYYSGKFASICDSLANDFNNGRK